MTTVKNREEILLSLPILSVSELAHQSFRSSYVCIVYCLVIFLGFYRLAYETNSSYNMVPMENSFWISWGTVVDSGVRLPNLEFQLVTLSVEVS